jgi:hypothetical protein
MAGETAMNEPNLRFVGIVIDTAGVVGPDTAARDKPYVEQVVDADDDDAKPDVVETANELKERVELCVAAAMVDLAGTKHLGIVGGDPVGPVQDSTISSTVGGDDELDIGALMELAMG